MNSHFPPYSIFVSSSDSYADLYDVFFDMFQRFWPDYQGEIYLQTENKEYKHADLNIICTKVGKHKAFGETLRAGLDKVPNDNILFIMIDYMFMGPVDSRQLSDLYHYFCQNSLASLCLTYQDLPSAGCSDRKDINKYLKSDHVFSYQIAFWKKDMLKEMALPHENPWTSEWYGNKRALKANLDIRGINGNASPIFVYNPAGCLHQGKWLPDAVKFLDEQKYKVDFQKRGLYRNDYNTLRIRIKIKKNMILHGLKGSYWRKIDQNR